MLRWTLIPLVFDVHRRAFLVRALKGMPWALADLWEHRGQWAALGSRDQCYSRVHGEHRTLSKASTLYRSDPRATWLEGGIGGSCCNACKAPHIRVDLPQGPEDSCEYGTDDSVWNLGYRVTLPSLALLQW